MTKAVEKDQSTFKIETHISDYKKIRKDIDSLPSFTTSYFIIIDFNAVKIAAQEKVDEWLSMLSKILTDIAFKEYSFITREILDYTSALEDDPSSIDLLKKILNVITEIKDKSMEMEFRIADVQEQYRILEMYGFPIAPEINQSVKDLLKEWEGLVLKAEQTDFSMDTYKKGFSEFTQKDVNQFKD